MVLSHAQRAHITEIPMKCLILGGAGFIGTHLTGSLLADGFAVRIFDRPHVIVPPHILSSARVEIVEGDLLNDDDLESAVKGCEVVFHLVSTTLPKTSNDNPVYDVETNLVGTLRLLDIVRRHAVRKFVFLSSGGTVYGVPETIPIPEDHPTNPLVSYGITKLAIEKYLHLHHILHGLDYCILRVANPFGEWQRVSAAQGLVAVFLHRALCGKAIEIWGDGRVVRDYIYVGDVADALIRAIYYRGDERIFNIGSGEGRSILDVLSAIERLTGSPLRTEFQPSRAFDVPSNILDIRRAAALLEWQPRTNFSEGLQLTAKWIESAGDA